MLLPSADPVVLIMRRDRTALARTPSCLRRATPADQFAVIPPVLAPACWLRHETRQAR
jgi:hypothetical protein